MLRMFWALVRSSALLTVLRSTLPPPCRYSAWPPVYGLTAAIITSPTAGPGAGADVATAAALALPRFALETMAMFSGVFNISNTAAKKRKGGWVGRHQRRISEL
jgi:hypothetical protein